MAVSNQDGVRFYSDARLAELLDIRFPELEAARNELVARDLIACEGGIYQVLDLPVPTENLVWLRLPQGPWPLCILLISNASSFGEARRQKGLSFPDQGPCGTASGP